MAETTTYNPVTGCFICGNRKFYQLPNGEWKNCPRCHPNDRI